MSTHEIFIGMGWLFAACRANTALMTATPGDFWQGAADAGTAMPFGIIAFQSGMDRLTMNDVRVMDDLLFQAKIVGDATGTGIVAAANAAGLLDDLLKRTSGSTDDGLILSCSRQSPLQYDEILPTGEKRTHFGGLYRLLITQS